MSQYINNSSDSGDSKVDKLSSEDLAAIIIDALLRAGIISEAEVQKSIKIVIEEINVRKALGDY